MASNHYSGYRANLLQNAIYQMQQTGGVCKLRNERVTFVTADGRSCKVWFPPEGRARDLDIADMKEAIEYMSGAKAFTL